MLAVAAAYSLRRRLVYLIREAYLEWNKMYNDSTVETVLRRKDTHNLVARLGYPYFACCCGLPRQTHVKGRQLILPCCHVSHIKSAYDSYPRLQYHGRLSCITGAQHSRLVFCHLILQRGPRVTPIHPSPHRLFTNSSHDRMLCRQAMVSPNPQRPTDSGNDSEYSAQQHTPPAELTKRLKTRERGRISF